MVANAVMVQNRLAMCGRRKDKYIKSRKFEMSVSMSYFIRSTLVFYSLMKTFLISLLGSDY